MLDTIQEKVTANMKNYSTFFGHCWYVDQNLSCFSKFEDGNGTRTVYFIVRIKNVCYSNVLTKKLRFQPLCLSESYKDLFDWSLKLWFFCKVPTI